MNRTEKSTVIESFGNAAAAVPFIVLTEFRGTKVSQINQFRRDLEKNGMRFRVVKNTLARRAFGSIGVVGFDGHLKGMTGVVLSSPDGIASAKILRDLLKPLQTVQVRAGAFDGELYAAEAVTVVSSFLGREQMLAQLLRTIQEPARQLLSVLQAYAEKLDAENPAVEAAAVQSPDAASTDAASTDA